MCIPNSRYGLTLEWVTSENSTMLLESDILRLFFTGPYLVSSPLCSVSGVDCPCPFFHALLLLFASLLSSLDCLLLLASLLSSHQLSSLLSNCQLSALQPPTLLSPVTNSPLSCPTTNCLSLGRVVNSHSPPRTTSGYGEIFLSKNPLSGFVPKQTRLLWWPTPIVLQLLEK